MGEGAIRVTTGRSGIEVGGLEVSQAGGIAGRWGRGLSMRFPRAPSPRALALALRASVLDQADRWSLWTPVAFGLGCAAYFALGREPLGLVAWGAAALALGLLMAARRLNIGRGASLLLVLIAFSLAGFSAAKFRTDAVAGPVAPAMGEPAQIEGWVVDIASPGQSGSRIIIAPTRIEGLSAAETPSRVRITLRDVTPPEPGRAVRVLALVNPPPVSYTHLTLPTSDLV